MNGNAKPHFSALKFLDPYTVEDVDYFFGRDKEIEALHNKLFAEKTLLVYGPSGTGKTSIVQCGLTTRLNRTDWLQINVRRGNNWLESIIDKVSARAQTEVKEEADLQTHVHSLYLDYYQPILIVLDQFEELFTLGSREELESLGTALQQLVTSKTHVKVLIIIREEFYAQLTELESLMPDIFENRYRIEKMSRSQINETITQILKSLGLTESDHVQTLAESIAQRAVDETGQPDLTYLQLLLDALFGEGIPEGTSPDELLNELPEIDDILYAYLENALKEVDNLEAGLMILKSAVTGQGTRKPVSVEDVCTFSQMLGKPLQPDEVEQVLSRFVSLRVFSERDERGRFELRHDALARRIAEYLTKEDSDAILVHQFMQTALEQYESRGRLLNSEDLNYVLPFKGPLSRQKEFKELIQRSERKHKRAKWRKRFIAASIISIALIVLAVFTLFSVGALQMARESGKENLVSLAKTYRELAKQAAAIGDSMGRDKNYHKSQQSQKSANTHIDMDVIFSQSVPQYDISGTDLSKLNIGTGYSIWYRHNEPMLLASLLNAPNRIAIINLNSFQIEWEHSFQDAITDVKIDPKHNQVAARTKGAKFIIIIDISRKTLIQIKIPGLWGPGRSASEFVGNQFSIGEHRVAFWNSRGDIRVYDTTHGKLTEKLNLFKRFSRNNGDWRLFEVVVYNRKGDFFALPYKFGLQNLSPVIFFVDSCSKERDFVMKVKNFLDQYEKKSIHSGEKIFLQPLLETGYIGLLDPIHKELEQVQLPPIGHSSEAERILCSSDGFYFSQITESTFRLAAKHGDIYKDIGYYEIDGLVYSFSLKRYLTIATMSKDAKDISILYNGEGDSEGQKLHLLFRLQQNNNSLFDFSRYKSATSMASKFFTIRNKIHNQTAIARANRIELLPGNKGSGTNTGFHLVKNMWWLQNREKLVYTTLPYVTFIKPPQNTRLYLFDLKKSSARPIADVDHFLGVSSDRHIAFVSGDKLKIIDGHSGQICSSINLNTTEHHIKFIRISHDFRYLLIMQGNNLHVLTITEKGITEKPYPSPLSEKQMLKIRYLYETILIDDRQQYWSWFLPDGRLLFWDYLFNIRSNASQFHIWDFNSNEIRKLSVPSSGAIDPCHGLSFWKSNTNIQIFDILTGKLMATVKFNERITDSESLRPIAVDSSQSQLVVRTSSSGITPTSISSWDYSRITPYSSFQECDYPFEPDASTKQIGLLEKYLPLYLKQFKKQRISNMRYGIPPPYTNTSLGRFIKQKLNVVYSRLNEGTLDPNIIVENKCSILMAAIFWGKNDLVKKLLDSGADPNFRSRLDLSTSLGFVSKTLSTPLETAVEVENLVALKELIKYGVLKKINKPSATSNETFSGLQALVRSIELNNTEIVSLLLKHGVEVNGILKKHPYWIEIWKYEQYTALAQAVRLDNVDIARILLQHGADPNVPVQIQCYVPDHISIEIVKMSPLSIAVDRKDKKLLDLLLAHGARLKGVGRRPHEYSCPLHLAVLNQDMDILKYLLEKGADPHEKDRHGLTALDWAKKFNQTEMVKLLQSHK